MDSDPLEFWRKMKQNIPILQNYFYLNMNISNIWENLQVSDTTVDLDWVNWILNLI